MTLNFYPPCPKPAGISILDIDPRLYAMECKVNGCRVLVLDGVVYNRHGTVLTKSKGADRVLAACGNLPPGVCLEGEWEDRTGTLHVFDLPFHDGTYTGRVAELQEFMPKLTPGNGVSLRAIDRCDSRTFRDFYDCCKREGAEGVVAKRLESRYERMARPNTESSSWLKRRFDRISRSRT